jgi:hypothetical protein
MAISFEWRGHNGSNWGFLVGTTNVYGFYGAGGYGSPIQVGQYNDSMHIRTSVSDDTDACQPPHLTNLKYISANEVSVKGGAPIAVSAIAQENLIRITVLNDVNISIIGTRFYAYDGTNVDNPPANVTLKAFKLGDAAWAQPHGRVNALSLGTSETPATEHSFYLGMSLSPVSTGASSLFIIRLEVDIS